MLLASAISPSDYLKMIVDNGPAGLLMLVVFVLLGVAIKQRTQAPNNPVNQGIYVYTWVMIGVLIVVTTIVWWIPRVARQAVVRGTINNLPLSYLVRGGNNPDELSVYTRPETDGPGDARLKFHWLAMDPHPFKGELSIVVYAPSSANQTEANSYGRELILPVDSASGDGQLTIVYNNDDSYSLRPPDGGDPKPLKINTAFSRRAPLASPSDGIVYAADALDESAMKARLEAPDPVIRRQARQELAGLGMDAMPFADKALADPQSSPALRFGVLAALASMKNDVPSETKLSGPALVFAMKAVSDKNPDISNSAQAYVNKRGAFQVHQALVEWMTATHRQSPSQRLNDDAIAAMDFMYLYGINEKDAYGGHRDQTIFNASLHAFQLGWSDRIFAEPDQQIYFAESLYGWGLLLADRAVLEKKPDGAKDPQLIQAAQEKFSEFLKAAAPVSRGPRYPYPNQLATARSYLVTPIVKI